MLVLGDDIVDIQQWFFISGYTVEPVVEFDGMIMFISGECDVHFDYDECHFTIIWDMGIAEVNSTGIEIQGDHQGFSSNITDIAKDVVNFFSSKL